MSADGMLQAGTVEEAAVKPNIRWTLDKPEYLLILVITFILWTPGFIELLNNSTENAAILGLYSPGYFLAMVAYVLLLPVLLILMFFPGRSGWLTGMISFIQQRSWLALGLLAFIGFAIWVLVTVEPNFGNSIQRTLSRYPFVRFSIAGVLLIFGGLILFGGWGKTGPVPIWRKAVAWILAALLLVEVALQIAAFAGVLPGAHRADRMYVPLGRIYQNEEGFSNASANNYGVNYPDFIESEGDRRLLLLGDSNVEALQIASEDHMGVALQSLQNEANPDAGINVMALGMPGFGPTLSLDPWALGEIDKEFDLDEIVLIFHLANDFQRTAIPSESDLVLQRTANGGVELVPEAKKFQHDLSHFVERSFRANLDPLAAFNTYLLTPGLLANFEPPPEAQPEPLDIPSYQGYIIDASVRGPGFSLVTDVGLTQTPGETNFIFEKDASPEALDSIDLATGLLEQTKEYLDGEGIDFSIVTIPAFPAAFYTENQGAEWTPEIGPYDLFGPERALQEFANEAGIPLLALGQYMQNDELTAGDVQDLYFEDGLGHLSEEGHAYIAGALLECFLSEPSPETAANCGTE